MALPDIRVNSSTGSDTAASGAGPATALTGTGASLTASTSIDLSADSPNLSGVATDGSAVLWVKTSSGRQYSKITAVNNSTKIVTVSDAYSVTESGKTWGIGGKRATLDHADTRVLLTASTGMQPGWTMTLETDGAATISSALVLGVAGTAAGGPITIQGSAEGRVMNQTGSANHFQWTGANNPTLLLFRNLKFTNSNATKTNAIVFNANTGTIYVNTCIFGDSTNKILNAIARNAGTPLFILDDVEIIASATSGVGITGTQIHIFGEGVWIHGCTSHGIAIRTDSICNFNDSIISGNGGDGINLSSGTSSATTPLTLSQCVIHGNTGDGLDMSASIHVAAIIHSCNITGNGGYGINAVSGQSLFQNLIEYNNFGSGGTANTSGARNNLNASTGDQTVDPGYVNAAGNNFAAGTAIKALGFPASTRTIGANQSSTTPYVDIGAQRQEAGSGVPSGFNPPLFRGRIN